MNAWLLALSLAFSTAAFSQQDSTIVQLPATPKRPSSSICLSWLKLDEINSDLAQCGLYDDLGGYSQFLAYPVKGGAPIALAKLDQIDRLNVYMSSTAPIAVYLVHKDWFLIHSGKTWYW